MTATFDRSKRKRRGPPPADTHDRPAAPDARRRRNGREPGVPPFLRADAKLQASFDSRPGARLSEGAKIERQKPRLFEPPPALGRRDREPARPGPAPREPEPAPDTGRDDTSMAKARQPAVLPPPLAPPAGTPARPAPPTPAPPKAAAARPDTAAVVRDEPPSTGPKLPPPGTAKEAARAGKKPDEDTPRDAQAKREAKKKDEDEKKDEKDEKTKSEDADKKAKEGDGKEAGGRARKGGEDEDGKDAAVEPGAVADAKGAAAAVDPEEIQPEPLPPRPRAPRLGGIQARSIPPPPRMSEERVREIVSRTGMTPDAHHASIRRRLSGIASRALRLQAKIARQARLAAFEAVATFETRASEVPIFTANAEERVRGAYGAARARVRDVYKKTMGRVTSRKREAGEKLKSATESMEAQIQRVLASSSPEVRELHKQQMAIVDKTLQETAQSFEKELLPKEKAMRAAPGQAVTTGTGPIVAARREAELQSWSDRTGQKADDIKRSITTNSAQVLAQKEPLSLFILQLVNPAAVQVEEVGKHEKGEVKKGRKKTTVRVATDYERAVNALNKFKDTAIKSLNQGERAAVKEIRAIGRRVEADFRTRGENLDLSISETALDLVEAYKKQMGGLNESLEAEGLMEVDRYEPLLLGAERRLERMHEGQSAELEATVASALEEAVASAEAQLEAADELAAKSAGEAGKIADQQTSGMEESTSAFERALTAPADAATAKASPYSARSTETLGARPKQVGKSVEDQLDKVKEGAKKTITAEKTRIDKELEPGYLAKSLSGSLKADGLKKISELADRCQRARNAMVGAGTKEGPLMAALINVTAIQGKAMERIWSDRGMGRSSLRQWLKDDLSGDELRAANAYLSGNTAEGARWELEASMSWYGDDEARVERVLRDLQKPPPPGGHIKELQQTEGWKETHKRLKSNLDGTDLKVTDALLVGNKHRADALRLKDKIETARRRGDDDAVNKLLEGIPTHEMPAVRREFAAIQRGLGPKENLEISDKDASRVLVDFVTKDRVVYDPHSAEHGGPRYRTMTLKGGQKKLAVALASRSGNPSDIESRVAIQAARMEVETSRKGKPDREKLSKAFEYDEAAELDLGLRSPDPKVKAAAEERREEARKVRMLAMRRFAAEKKGLKDLSEKDALKYAEDTVGELFKDDAGKAYGRSMVRDGFAKPELAMRLAVEGSGTDEDLVKRTLGRLDKKEIAKLRKDYKEKYKEDLDDRLGTSGKGWGELSGDERLEVELLLLGRPTNDKERYELELKRTEQQKKETGRIGKGLMAGTTDEHLMNDANKRLIAIVEDAGGVEKAFDEHGRFIGDPSKATKGPDPPGLLEPDMEQAWAFNEELKWNQFGAESYQAGIDRMTNAITTAIAVIAAVVVAIAVPGVGGAIAGAIIGGLLSMGAKAAIKGGRYGWEEAGVDLAVTAVDAATAGLTHGMGQAMRTAGAAAKGASVAAKRSAGKLAGLAAKGRSGKAAAYVLSEGIENFVSSVPSAFVGQALNDQNWKGGSPFGNILKGTFLEAGISTGIGLGVGTGMDIAGGALGAMRGAMRSRAMRKELLKSMPPGLRDVFGDVPVLELPPAQFKQMTGSDSGQAVTVFTPDGPAVYVREGADPRVLREEGLHLMQSREAEWSGKVADLSEANLARWPEMSLGEQLSLYRNKLDIEIDAQRRMLDDLGDELALAGPLARRGLRRRIREIETALDNLQRRRIEVDRFTPERIQKITSGAEPRPDYLEQPPRLFNKKTKSTKAEEPEGPDPQTQKVALPAEKGDPSYSPLAGRGIEGTVVQIGPSWKEKGREYRLVGVMDEAGNVSHQRQEIRSAHEDKRWVKRGSESRKRGEIAEAASARMSTTDVRDGWTTAPIQSQWDASGRGFDEVLLDFRMEGEELVARVRVVEVKDYPGYYVPKDSFTAIRPPPDGNLEKNLKFIEKRLNEIGTLDPPAGYGLTRDQVDAALLALRTRDIDLEIRITPDTKLGGRERGTVLKDIEGEWGRFGIPNTEARVKEIGAGDLDAAAVDVQKGTAPSGIAPRPPEPGTPKAVAETGAKGAETSEAARVEGAPESPAEAAVKTPEQGARTEVAPTAAARPDRPTGASGPLGSLPPSQLPPGQRVILEPFTGPSVESPLHLAERDPGALVIGTEARMPPSPADVRRLEEAGGMFVADNFPTDIPPGSVDQIFMRYPLPHNREVVVDVRARRAELKEQYPEMSDREILEQIGREAIATPETLVNYGPYALERLRPGGEMEVVFWEPEILSDDIHRVLGMRFLDPETGQAYRFELEGPVQVPRGEVAPHSGLGIPKEASVVYQARLRKVPVESGRPTGASGPERGHGVEIGEASGRPYHPERAGGPVRDLDWRKVKVTDKGVDVVERHIGRFDGGGELELLMVDRLRRIARGEIEATEADLRFYTHELREFVRYRKLGWETGQPRSDEEAFDLWQQAHTATLEDYGLREGAGVLYHPDVEARGRQASGPTGASGGRDGSPEAGDPARGGLEPPVRRAMEIELEKAGHPREGTAKLTDSQLAALHARSEPELVPARLEAFRGSLDPEARTEFDRLASAGAHRLQEVDAQLAARLATALDVPVRVDPTLPPGEIRVRHVLGPEGDVRGFEIVAGREVKLQDVLQRVPTLHALRRHEDLSRRVAAAADWTRRAVASGREPAPGSPEHQAWQEIESLSEVLASRRRKLGSEDLDEVARLRLEGEIAELEERLARSLATLEQTHPGLGTIAAHSVADLEAGIAGAVPGGFERALKKAKRRGDVPRDWTVERWVVEAWYPQLARHLPLTPEQFARILRVRAGTGKGSPITPKDLDNLGRMLESNASLLRDIAGGSLEIDGRALELDPVLQRLAGRRMTEDQLRALSNVVAEANRLLRELDGLTGRVPQRLRDDLVAEFHHHLADLNPQQLIQLNRETAAIAKMLRGNPAATLVTARQAYSTPGGEIEAEIDIVLEQGGKRYAVEVESIPNERLAALTSTDPHVRQRAIDEARVNIERKREIFERLKKEGKIPKAWELVVTTPVTLPQGVLDELSRNVGNTPVINDVLPP